MARSDRSRHWRITSDVIRSRKRVTSWERGRSGCSPRHRTRRKNRTPQRERNSISFRTGGTVNVSVLIATFGEPRWERLAWDRARPSAEMQGAEEILCFHDPEGTLASARNELGRTAKGDWLCFLDADDELAPGYLDAMQRIHEQEISSYPSLLLTPAVQYVSTRGQKEPPKFWAECSLTTGNWMVIGTLVPRQLFLEVGGFEEWPIYEDWALWGRCWKAGARPVRVPDAIYLAHRKRGLTRNHALHRREINRVYQEIRQAVFG